MSFSAPFFNLFFLGLAQMIVENILFHERALKSMKPAIDTGLRKKPAVKPVKCFERFPHLHLMEHS